MIFRKDEIDVDTSYASRAEYVRLDTVLERVTETIKDKMAFERDYTGGEWIDLVSAEKLIMKMYALINEFNE